MSWGIYWMVAVGVMFYMLSDEKKPDGGKLLAAFFFGSVWPAVIAFMVCKRLEK